MATPMNLSFRFSLAVSMLLAGTILPRAAAQTAPAVVPVPMNAALVGDGIAPLAVNACGGNATLQASSIPTTSGNGFGDNCPASGGLLSSPQGAAVDSYGNVYVADYSDRLVRVVYQGGSAVAAMITAANNGYLLAGGKSAPAPTPIVGDIYTIAGLGSSSAAYVAPFTLTDTNGKFVCTNIVVAGQTEALDSYGDGCPGAAAPVGPRDVALDSQGNLFITDYTNNRVRVLCVSCTTTAMATKLIQLENPGVTPVNGAIYTIAGYSVGYRDGPGYLGTTSSATSTIALLRSPVQAVTSSSDDVFIADNLNNAVRLLYNGGAVANAILAAEGYTGATAPVAGSVYTIVGDGCTQAPTTTNGSSTTYECIVVKPGTSFTPETVAIGNGIATGAVWSVYLDANSNLFYTSDPDSTNDRVKVLYGGVALPLTFPGSTYSTTTFKTGYAYTFAGQGTFTQSGVAPSQEILNAAESISGDANGNLFFFDYGTGLLYETYAQNGLTSIIGGGNAIATPVAGAYCNGGTTGPTMTDAFYNGCPLTQAKFSSPRGPVVADASGNLYFGDSVGYFVRKFSYNPMFPTTAIGSSSTSQPYAFTFLSSQTLAAPTFRVSSDFVDAGNGTCNSGLAAVGGGPGTTCVVNVKFAPSVPGLRAGAVDLSSASAVLGGSLMTGNAIGAGLAVDPGTSVTTGSTYTPNGIAVDSGERVYFTDGASKSVILYSGGTATTVATGYKNPTGVAADAAGNVYVADATANTITEVPIAGTSFVLTSAVSSPNGLATDGAGHLYIADTGNNRVLIFGPGAITPIVAAFTGLSAPQAVAVDSAGNLYAVDSTHVVKLTAAGVQTTVATSGGSGLAVDAAGNVLITSGTTLLEYPAAGGSAVTLSSALLTPKGAAMDGVGDVYIADSSFNGYIELERTVGYYKFITNPASTTVQLSSIGTATVSTTAYTQTDTTDYTVTSATTNGCSGALLSGTTCALSAAFNPKVAGVVTDTLTFTAPVSNGNPTMTLTTVSLVPAISVQASPLTLNYGSTETLTATIYGPSNTSGTVIFYSGTTQLASVAATASATAVYAYVPLVGVYSITATFTPTGSSTPTVTSQPVTVTVKQATPAVKLSLSATTGYTTTSVTMTATVTPPAAGTPTGTVAFYAGTTSLGSSPLASNIATLTVSNLSVGTDCITAVYSGDSNFVTATSSCTTITVAPGFGVTATSLALAFQPNYQEAQTYLVVNPGGTTYTLTFACQGLPAKLNCLFTPATLPLTGVTTAQNVQLLVSNSGATAGVHGGPLDTMSGARTVTLAMLPLAALALFFGSRRRRLPMLLALALLALGASTALTGCGNGGPTALEQAPGSYAFTVTVNSGTTTLQTLNFTLTIPTS